MKNNLISTLLVCSLALTAVSLPAVATATDVQITEQNQKIDALKTKEAEAEQALAEIETEMLATAEKVDKLSETKELLTEEIKNLYNEISDLNVRIQKRDVQMQKQARDVQVSGNGTSYLEVILNSESLSDALTRVQSLTALVNANNDLLDQQTEDKAEVDDKTKTVESQISVLETAVKELDKKTASLETLKIQQEIAKNELEAERATEESKKAEYTAQKTAAEQKLAEQEAEQKRIEEEKEKLVQEILAQTESMNIIEEDGTTSAIQKPAQSTSKYDDTDTAMPGSAKNVSAAKQAVVSAALADCGNSYPTGWGAQGECLVSVRRWLSAGNIGFAVGGPHSGYVASGAVQISWADVQPGDVVQYENIYSPEGWIGGVHTVLIVGVENGIVQIVEANNPGGSGYVSTNKNWRPAPPANFRAVVWRFPG
ncbi:coiled-coil domain-containing protein [Enterococcus sp. CWB-B31]|uniref:coiled-coil domain-containing protein n=1 Tax=Enterococcus sp. CWB-B31 TaxID=2885159 RepID=UPI001E51F2E8|nr:CHAP domain-containing protein [Enterococcus sp. CWB-B31]MCB5953643.1 CHAP domain-containing protein [Enterococcus sp. CWB-B31]